MGNLGADLKKADPYTTGRPRKVDLREVINAIFYLNKTGCQWRYLPKDFPHYTLISYYYHKWVDNISSKSTQRFISNSEKKWVEMSIQVQGLSIAKLLRGHRNQPGNPGSTVVS